MQDLTVRLKAVYDLAAQARARLGEGRVLDVGSDHGFLALRCLENNIATNVVCTDIHKEPAQRSRFLLESNGYADRSSVAVTDGLDGVELMPRDIVVIAGMGGLNIIDILSRALRNNPDSVLKDIEIVLQCQKSTELVREFAASNGLAITEETVCNDRNFFYSIINLKFTGEMYQLKAEELYYGPQLLKKEGDFLIKAYFDHLDEIYKIRSQGDERIRDMIEGRLSHAD